MTPLQILAHEHRLVRHFVDVLSQAVRRLERNDMPPTDFFRNMVVFFREFIDRHHHIKEENQMFALLALRTEGLMDQAIVALRHQHDRSRWLVKAIETDLDKYDQGDDLAITSVLESASAYCSLLRQHVNREDHDFFPAVKKLLKESDMEHLSRQFADAEDLGGKRLEYFSERVDEMAKLVNA